MIDPSDFRKSRDRTAKILDGSTRLEPEELFEQPSEELDLYVHPGYGSYTDLVDETLGLSRRHYAEFEGQIYDSLEESVKSSRNTAVLYPEDRLEETETFLDPVDTGDIAYVPTAEQSALPANAYEENGLVSGESMMAGVLEGVEDGGTVNLYGEVRHMCTSNARWLVENTESEIEKSYTVSEEELFPEGVIVPAPFRAVHLGESVPEPVRQRAGDFVESFYTPDGF